MSLDNVTADDDSLAISVNSPLDSSDPQHELAAARETLVKLSDIVRETVVGRDEVIELCIIALVSDGHVLLEDFPGSGKTTLAKTLGEAIVGKKVPLLSSDNSIAEQDIAAFRRIQFTPDLLPSDVTGVPIFDPSNNSFHFRRGPLFAHVVLADEINRTSPKVQSAMLEAMGEKQVSVDNTTYPLGELFFVIATQNPLDLVGTYPLPTPQLDRFLFKLTMEHIDRDAELAVLSTHLDRQQGSTRLATENTVTQESLLRARRIIASNVVVSDAIKVALVDISRALRRDSRVLQGNSTRSIVLMLLALKAAAALDGRNYVSAADIEKLLPHVFAHRLELAPGAGDVYALLSEIMMPAMEQLARSTLR
ncbi:MAG: AAA family ATPase [Proteobacteria bacterium]|nr:AAA family ATPase [Pseudomonadota bacterium]MDA0895574.1 AAA family ATPase [Pseudomonadota bacterium]MDA1244113.1 AAA family ATPase [Pseudomonadota bacterium]